MHVNKGQGEPGYKASDYVCMSALVILLCISLCICMYLCMSVMLRNANFLYAVCAGRVQHAHVAVPLLSASMLAWLGARVLEFNESICTARMMDDRPYQG